MRRAGRGPGRATGGDLVFVYGTLRRGGRNHRLLAGAERVGEWRTPAAYVLFHLGPYPGAWRGGRTAIAGEVYRVGRGTLARLDRLEDLPREYRRERIDTPFGRAWIYLLRRPPRRRRPIRSGTWPVRGPGPS